jgi:hypothetical protein
MSAAPASAAVNTPCKLVTRADAERALGAAVKGGKVLTVSRYRECIYTKGAKGVVVLVRKLSRSGFDKTATKNPGPVVHLGGIGSDADSVAGGSGLLLWKTGTEVTVTVDGASDTLAAEKMLGRIAAARL